MASRSRLCTLAALALVALFAVPAAAVAEEWTQVGVASGGIAISSSGVVVGNQAQPDGSVRGFRWDVSGGRTLLATGCPAKSHANVIGIADDGSAMGTLGCEGGTSSLARWDASSASGGVQPFGNAGATQQGITSVSPGGDLAGIIQFGEGFARTQAAVGHVSGAWTALEPLTTPTCRSAAYGDQGLYVTNGHRLLLRVLTEDNGSTCNPETQLDGVRVNGQSLGYSPRADGVNGFLRTFPMLPDGRLVGLWQRPAGGNCQCASNGVTWTELAKPAGAGSYNAPHATATGAVFGQSWGGTETTGQSSVVRWASPEAQPEKLFKTALSNVVLTVSGNGKWILMEDGRVFSAAAEPTVSGRVRGGDGAPAAGVKVRVFGPETVEATTDAQGRYTAAGLAPGSYDVSVTSTGSWCVDQAGACKQSRSVALPPDATVDFVERPYKIQGRIVTGADGTHPDDASPARDVPVRITGKSTDGDDVDETVRTNQDGRYELPVEPGAYSAELPDYACVRDVSPCRRTQAVTVVQASATVDGVARSPELETIVEAPDVTLELAKAGWVEKVVNVKITVRNNGQVAATKVRLHDDLTIGTKDQPLVPIIPIDEAGKPARADLGTIAPGKEATTTLPIKVSGDGEYSLGALVEAVTGDGRNVVAPGRGTLKVLGRFVHVDFSTGGTGGAKPGLVRGGGNWTIDVRLANRSYQRRVVVDPVEVALRGNALDGHLQVSGQPIPPLESMDAAAPSRHVQLEPRETKDMVVVVRTTLSNAFDDSASPPGGTQSRATLKDPRGNLVTRAGDLGARLGADDVLATGEHEYRVGIDDSAPPVAPSSFAAVFSNVAAGTVQGLWNFTAGTIRGVFVDLPALVYNGVKAIPSAVLFSAQTVAELWTEVRKDPKLVAEFFAYYADVKARAFELAPVLKELGKRGVDAANKAAFAHYERLWKQWYAGDYESAVREFTTESVEGTANAASLVVAPGVLARMPKVAASARVARTKLAATINQQLAKYPRLVRVREATLALEKVVKPGFELADRHLAALYGYSAKQVAFLRNYAKTNKLLIVARNRAAESIKWLETYGAVLKHEAIKLKNVDWIDAAYLGYRHSDIGRVVIPRRPPDLKKVLARMKHLSKNSPEWRAIMERYEARVAEYRKKAPGYVRWMRDNAGDTDKGRKIQLKWNMKENWMDPKVAKDSYTSYRFRLRKDGDFEIPEFFVKDKWRCITGDMDLLQITHATGRPLTDVERLKVYGDFARSILGLMHPESATWTLMTKGGPKFDFAAKVNEFKRSATPPVQFGPDGVARAVRFDSKQSYFKDKLNYRIFWQGGYSLTRVVP